MECQYTSHINANALLDKLRTETTVNADRYVDYIDGNGLVSLMDGLNGYILDKIYNSSFGDLVPIIIANAIRIDIWILIEDGNNISTELIKCTNNTDQNKTRTVMLHKKGKHYNAIIPIDKPVGTRNNNIASCDDNVAISLVNRYHVLHHDCTAILKIKTRTIAMSFLPLRTYNLLQLR